MHPMMSTIQCHIRNYQSSQNRTVQTPTGMGEQEKHGRPNSQSTLIMYSSALQMLR